MFLTPFANPRATWPASGSSPNTTGTREGGMSWYVVQRDSIPHDEYTLFVDDYLSRGPMREARAPASQQADRLVHHIAHHLI